MLKKLCELLTIFDWVSPAVAVFEQATGGNSWTFAIPVSEMEAAGWGEIPIRMILAQRGINSYAVLMFNGELQFAVPMQQAAYAYYLLAQNGVPVTESTANPPTVRK